MDVDHVREDPSRAERPVDSDRVSCHPENEDFESAARIAGSAFTVAV